MADRCPACGFLLSGPGAPLAPGRRRTAILLGRRLTLSSEALAVLDCICAGRRTRDIAAHLRLPLPAVNATIRRLRAATASRTTAQMVARLVRCGLGHVDTTVADPSPPPLRPPILP